MNTLGDIDFFVIIAGRTQKEPLSIALSEHGGKLINITYGKGSVKSSKLLDAFGFVPEENKVIISCLLPKKKSECMLNVLIEKFNFNKPNTGIAFTIPVDELSF